MPNRVDRLLPDLAPEVDDSIVSSLKDTPGARPFLPERLVRMLRRLTGAVCPRGGMRYFLSVKSAQASPEENWVRSSVN